MNIFSFLLLTFFFKYVIFYFIQIKAPSRLWFEILFIRGKKK